MDKLEKQLNAEEFNEEIAMIIFKVLKNQLQQFMTMQISMDSDDQKTNHFFTEYTLSDAQMFHNILIHLMDSIEKAIAERGLYERVHDSRINERTMQTHERMINKDASKIDNNVAGASHDKDNITEKIGLGYTDPCPLGQAIAYHPKLYDAEVLGLHYVKPDVHDTVEILNDAEENPSTSNVSSELSLDESDVPPKEMPNEGKLLKLFVKMDNEIKKLVTFNLDFHMDKHRNVDRQWIQQLFSHEVVPISRSLNECSTIIQQEITDEVKEMLDIFESMERKVDRTSKKNEILQNTIDQLLEVNIANDVKNLVMQSYVEIKNNEEIQRFSKESKDSVKFCNDVVEVKEKLSKQIFQLEKDFAKLEAQSIAFEIALQHKTQENNSLKTFQKENENFMASLQIENAHLKQTYKDLFESVQSSRVETIQCDEVKIKFDFDKIETQNIKLEHHNAFADEVKGVTMGKLNVFDKENCDFGSKVTHLEKIIAQKKKDFDDVKLELTNRTAKFETYFEKLKNTKVVLERQLARKVDDSKAEKDQFLKEIIHLRTQLENLKGKSVKTKFDKSLILGKPPVDKLLITSQLSKSWSTPKVVVQKDFSKPVTAQSLPKNEKDQLLKQIALLESKLASQDLCSCQKEYHELRTSYNALKVKFDSLNQTKRKTNVSKSSKPKVFQKRFT
ncbi:hypothetical protein Tco_0826837 [Tanacetum coccineum]